MKEKRFSEIMAAIFLFGHIGLVPFVLLVPKNFSLVERYDVLLIIGPLTAAYFVSLTSYVIDGRYRRDDSSENVTALYIMFALVIMLAFLGGTYGTVLLADHQSQGLLPSSVKVPISIVEMFVGGAFALIFKALFPQDQPHT